MTKELMKDILTILCCWTVIVVSILALEGSGHGIFEMSGNILQLVIKGSI